MLRQVQTQLKENVFHVIFTSGGWHLTVLQCPWQVKKKSERQMQREIFKLSTRAVIQQKVSLFFEHILP